LLGFPSVNNAQTLNSLLGTENLSQIINDPIKMFEIEQARLNKIPSSLPSRFSLLKNNQNLPFISNQFGYKPSVFNEPFLLPNQGTVAETIGD
jgi:hypothetical protein